MGQFGSRLNEDHFLVLYPNLLEQLSGHIDRLVDLYNRDLAEGLDRLMAILPKGDSQKSVEPFRIDVSTLDMLTEKPAGY